MLPSLAAAQRGITRRAVHVPREQQRCLVVRGHPTHRLSRLGRTRADHARRPGNQGPGVFMHALPDIGMALAKIEASMCRAHSDLKTPSHLCSRRNIMKRILVIADIPRDPLAQSDEATLTPAQMRRIVGGRSVAVTVDGGPGKGTVDD